MLEEELEKMGYDQEKQKNQYATFIKVVTAPFMVVGYAGYGLYELVVSLNKKAFEAKQSEEQKQFKQKVSQALSNLLQIDIEIAESCMNTTMTR